MKKMKLFALALLLVSSSVAIAQPRGGGQNDPERKPQQEKKSQADRMVEELGLSEDQTASLLEINQKYDEKKEKDINKLLTSEQQEKYAELLAAKAERKEQQGEARPEGGKRPQGEARPEGGKRPQGEARGDRSQMMTDRMAKQLDLSEEQAASLLEINKKFAEDAKELRTEVQAKLKEDQQALKSTRSEEIAKILTTEQQEKLAEMKEQPRGQKGGKEMRGKNNRAEKGERRGAEGHRPPHGAPQTQDGEPALEVLP